VQKVFRDISKLTIHKSVSGRRDKDFPLLRDKAAEGGKMACKGLPDSLDWRSKTD